MVLDGPLGLMPDIALRDDDQVRVVGVEVCLELGDSGVVDWWAGGVVAELVGCEGMGVAGDLLKRGLGDVEFGEGLVPGLAEVVGERAEVVVPEALDAGRVASVTDLDEAAELGAFEVGLELGQCLMDLLARQVVIVVGFVLTMMSTTRLLGNRCWSLGWLSYDIPDSLHPSPQILYW